MSSSSALSPPAQNPPRSSSRSPRRRKRGKGRGKDNKEGPTTGDDGSSRASSASPSPSPSPSPSATRAPSSLSQPPLTAAADSSPSASTTATPPRSALKKTTTTSSPAAAQHSPHPFPNFSFLRRTIEPRTPLTPYLNNPTSAWARHAQPATLLAYAMIRFPALVADPENMLLGADAVVIGALQLAWCMTCIPPWSGRRRSTTTSSSSTSNPSSHSNTTSPSSASSTPLRKKASRSRLGNTPTKLSSPSPSSGVSGSTGTHKGNYPALTSRLTTALLSLPLALAATVPLLVLVVLFGAPATTHGWHTLGLSLHLALLVALPLVYAHGVDDQAWWEAAGLMLPGDAVWGSALGGCVGAWLGAVPIPLDWDRDWQNWPITIVVGSYLGSILGRYLGAYVLTGRRLRFEDDDEEEQEDRKEI